LPETDQFGVVDQTTDQPLHPPGPKLANQAQSSELLIRKVVGARQDGVATKARRGGSEESFQRRLVDARPEPGALFRA
jgi:hypothetical protein